MNNRAKVLLGIVALILLGVLARALFFSSADGASFDPEAIPIIVPGDMPALTRKPVMLTGGEVDLEAELLLPAGGRASKPAVVFVTGSGDSHFRDYTPGFIETFIEGTFLPNDIAVLLMNKRGVGASEGHWQQNDIQGRADDIYTAVRYLQDHTAIDADRVGVIGYSQGGWVASLVSAQHDDVAFFITLAGPTTAVAEQIALHSRNSYRCEGIAEADLDRKVDNHLRTLRAAATLGQVIPVGDLAMMAGILNYDPRPAFEELSSPGLLLFGGADALVPPPDNLARLDEIFPDGIPETLTVVVIQGANHGLHLVTSDCMSWAETQTLPFADELVTTMNGWLADQGLSE